MLVRNFGVLPSGETVEAYTLANHAGASVDVLTYGGIVTALRIPDRRGGIADVVLGGDSLGDYLARHPYFGAIVGRIAGRVRGGRLAVGERVHQLACNDGAHHLHGGETGLDRRLWQARPWPRDDGAASLRLTYRSPAGEEGYPGTIDLAITYTLTADNAFVIESEATSDEPTPLALTHHSYFNLAGESAGSVVDHQVQIFADAFAPTDASLCCTGERRSVEGRPNDLRPPRRLGDVLPALFQAHGDFYLLRPPFAERPRQPTLAARVVEPVSGRVLEVSTDESGLQFYTGAMLNARGKSGRTYGAHAGLCLECQSCAGATHTPALGDLLVRPGEPQRRRTIYAFSTV